MIEWSRLEGAQVEDLVALLINREFPKSIRITPSSGDGGIDILLPQDKAHKGDTIFQVKKFSGPLTNGQKTQILGSLSSLVSDKRWEDLDITEWNLVLPWDPTPEALKWFREITKAYEFKANWLGLNFIESLTSKYPEIPDYLIHGRRDELLKRQQELMALLTLDSNLKGVDVSIFLPKIKSAIDGLQGNPYYHFGFRSGYGVPPLVSEQEGVVFSYIESDSNENKGWIAVDVIALCAESTHLSPIEIKGVAKVEKGSEMERSINDFLDFGKPVESVPFDAVIKAPGGLGGSFDGGKAFLGATSRSNFEFEKLKMDVVNQKGEVLAELDVDRLDLTMGAKGLRTIFVDSHQILEIELRGMRKDLRETQVTWSTPKTEGKPVSRIRPVADFLASCQESTVVRLGYRDAWPASASESIALTGALGHESMREMIASLQAWVSVLCGIQSYTSSVIYAPAIAEVTQEKFDSWNVIARILEGERVNMTYPAGGKMMVALPKNIEYVSGDLYVSVPFEFGIEDQHIDLGKVGVLFEKPTIISKQETQSHFIYELSTPDTAFSYMLPDVQEAI